jgi:2-iminobutanoate/2-iminopropanoate deaminase
MAEGQAEHRPPLVTFTRSRGLIFVAGHGCVNREGQFLHTDFEGQYRFTMDRLATTLEKAGVSFADVINVRCYVQNPSDIPTHNVIYREYFSEPYPSRTTIVNCLPPGLLFEIECVAAEPESGGASSNSNASGEGGQ